jgi:penicillin-binding protein 1A
VTATQALAESLNTIATQLVMEVGPDQVIKVAHRMGIESELQNNASIALGTSEVSLLELTAAYAPFMNGGYKATPHIVRRISKSDGTLLYENNYLEPPKVLNDNVVAAMNLMMRSVIDHGTGKKAQLKGWEAAGKTGTTQSFRDALFVGYTSNLTTGIWFGNDDGQSMKKVTGGGLPAKAWHDYMTAAHQGLAPAPLPGGDFIDPAPVEEPATIGTIISDVFQGGGEERYPGDPVYAEDYPAEPVPPGDVTGSAGPIPPGEVGGGQGTRRTTLLDLILGQ